MLKRGTATIAVLVLVAAVAWAASGPSRAAKPSFSVFYPPDPVAGAPAVVVVHGGSWQHGDGGKMRRIGKTIAAHGFVVFHVKYTYATDTRAGYPVQVDDIRRAIRYIRRNAGDYGIDPARIGALGSSSGAHLVGLLATQGEGPLDDGGRVRAAVTYSAAFDLNKLRRNKFAPGIKKFLGCKRKWCRSKAREGSPVTHVSPDDPPMLIVHGRNEIFPRNQPRRMTKRLRKAGVPYRKRVLKGTAHGASFADPMMKETVAFFRGELAE